MSGIRCGSEWDQVGVSGIRCGKDAYINRSGRVGGCEELVPTLVVVLDDAESKEASSGYRHQERTVEFGLDLVADGALFLAPCQTALDQPPCGK